MMKYQTHHGVKFCRDEKTGYYRNGTLGKLAHRYVWEVERGPIPDGHDIHHDDRDRSNNTVDNLMCLSRDEHKALHVREDMTFEVRAKRASWFRSQVSPKSVEWHKSPEGREWHQAHALRVFGDAMPVKDFACAHCRRQFSTKPMGKVAFCSNACKSAHRRASGVDNVARTCAYCMGSFTVNRHAKTETCSRACTNKRRDSVGAITAACDRLSDGRYSRR